MVVDKIIINTPLKPLLRGIYFLIAEKTDKSGYTYLMHKEAKKYMAIATFRKAIETFEHTGLISKDYKYFKAPTGDISRINRFQLILINPLEIPDEVVEKTRHLNLKEKGILYTLYLLKSDDNYIYSTIRQLSGLFDSCYQVLSSQVRVLEAYGYIEREKFRLKVKI